MTRLFSLGKWLCPVLTMLAAGCGSTPVLDPQSPDMVILVRAWAVMAAFMPRFSMPCATPAAPTTCKSSIGVTAGAVFRHHFLCRPSREDRGSAGIRNHPLAANPPRQPDRPDRPQPPERRRPVALGRLPTDTAIGPIILLAPAVSPDYDLSAALGHTNLHPRFLQQRRLLLAGHRPDCLLGNTIGHFRGRAIWLHPQNTFGVPKTKGHPAPLPATVEAIRQ